MQPTKLPICTATVQKPQLLGRWHQILVCPIIAIRIWPHVKLNWVSAIFPVIDEINASLNSTSRQSAVKVECPSVRVGDYNCSTPHEVGGGGYPVVFSKRGLMFSLPHAQFCKFRDSSILCKNFHYLFDRFYCVLFVCSSTAQKTVVCTLPLHKIFVVEANYSKSLPLLFLATGPRFAKDLRYLLGLSEDPENCGRYYDPVFGGWFTSKC